MSTLQIALIGLVIVLLLAWLWLRQRGDSSGGASRKAEKAADRIDTIIGWPPQATRVLSTQERLAFGTLVRALPEYMVLAQVPLSRFINVPKRNSYADWLRRIGYQSVDFVICDMSAQVVAVVELQPPQQSERAHKRLTRLGRTLKAAQLPLHVWRENALPSVDATREALLPRAVAATEPAKGSAAANAVTAAAMATPTVAAVLPATAAARSPFEDTGRDSTQDERIEPLEPPPTWFDDIDSDPVPLSKR
jgi:Protein of unknown function (DUF2726)